MSVNGSRKTPPVVLSIAGSDSSAGAGLQADIKTFAAHNVYGATVVTAITAQNTCGIEAVFPLAPQIIAAQLKAVFADLDIKAVKISMLGSVEAIAPIIEALDQWGGKNIIFDPVLSSGSGHILSPKPLQLEMVKMLFPRALLITPNLPEAAQLLHHREAETQEEMVEQVEALLQFGATAVYLKGGHGKGSEIIDLFDDGCQQQFFKTKRLEALHNHGTGCTFAASVTSHLAYDLPLYEAVRRAKEYISFLLANCSYMTIGKGVGPLNHLFLLSNEID